MLTTDLIGRVVRDPSGHERYLVVGAFLSSMHAPCLLVVTKHGLIVDKHISKVELVLSAAEETWLKPTTDLSGRVK